MAMVAGRARAVRARQPRHEADAQARRPRRDRSRTGWQRRWRSSTARRRSFAPTVAAVPRRAGQPLRARRRASWWSPTPGMKEEMQGRGSGKVRDFALVRRDDGRDRRVRPAGALQLGGGVPRPAPGSSTATRRCRAGVAEPHDQHRHRLRLRRQADGAALAGEGAGLGAGARDVRRAGPAVPRCRSPAPALSAQQANDDLLDIDDVLGKRIDRRRGCTAPSRSARRTPPRRWR